MKDAIQEDGEVSLSDESKKLIVDSIDLVEMHTYMDFTKHLNEYKVTYDVFPEVWETLSKKLVSESDNLSVTQFYTMVGYIAESGYSSEKVWLAFKEYISMLKIEQLRDLDLENQIKMRNIMLKQFPTESQLH